ncbi:hypothetical protein CK203_028139 [Vitis vinifera]|uniref:Uncharacterized protein n=1 Tax=Vitis vinifera TaxID=29760 RepID=A0A438IAX9_VITVI|nr:hypothetical protein CK203_028139 [Vitis vinifera]
MLLVCVGCTSIPYSNPLASVISFISVLTFASNGESFHYRKPPRMSSSACVEVMTTLHESVVSSEACRGLRTVGGLSLRSFNQDFISYTWVHLWAFKSIDKFDRFSFLIRVGGRSIRVSNQLDQTYMDSHVVTVDQFPTAMASPGGHN